MANYFLANIVVKYASKNFENQPTSMPKNNFEKGICMAREIIQNLKLLILAKYLTGFRSSGLKVFQNIWCWFQAFFFIFRLLIFSKKIGTFRLPYSHTKFPMDRSFICQQIFKNISAHFMIRSRCWQENILPPAKDKNTPRKFALRGKFKYNSLRKPSVSRHGQGPLRRHDCEEATFCFRLARWFPSEIWQWTITIWASSRENLSSGFSTR